MNALLILLVRRDCSWQLAAHLAAGIAALWLFFGTSRAPASVANAAPMPRVVMTTAANLAP